MADQTRWNEDRNRGRDPGRGQTFGREYGGRPFTGPDAGRRPVPTQGEGGYGSGYGGYLGSYAGTGGPVGRFGSDLGRRGLESGQGGFGSTREDRSFGVGESQRGRGPKGYQRPDERIREDINEALTDDETLDASDISVEVSNCEVTLSGTVLNRDDKRRAEDIAEDVSGVRHVQNDIRVEREGRAQYASSAAARAGWLGGK
jgi:hypothetical protein